MFSDDLYVRTDRLYRVDIHITDDRFLRPGDVLFVRSSVKEAGVGWPAIFKGHHEPVTNCGFLIRARQTSSRLEPKFVVHYLRQAHIRAQMISRAGKVAITNINQDRLGSLKIPMPSLAEQQRIAAILDKSYELRAKRRKILAQLDTLKQAIFYETFGDPTINPKGWPVRPLGSVAREKLNNGIFRKNPDYLQGGLGGLPVVWVEELFRGSSIDTRASRRVLPTRAEVSKYGLKYGDLLFCRSSLKLDGIAFNNVYLGPDGGALFECHLIRVQPDLKISSPIYLNTLLRLPQMRAVAKSRSKTATMTTIDQTSLSSIPVMLPPLTLQNDFARRLDTIEKLKTKHLASLAQMEALFASLQHRAFRGEL